VKWVWGLKCTLSPFCSGNKILPFVKYTFLF
jgi:hypothetical protein